jgi:hypothetical protein
VDIAASLADNNLAAGSAASQRVVVNSSGTVSLVWGSNVVWGTSGTNGFNVVWGTNLVAGSTSAEATSILISIDN